MDHVSYQTGIALLSAFMLWMALCFAFLIFSDVSKYGAAPHDYSAVNGKPLSQTDDFA
jgi:hypothetical protein